MTGKISEDPDRVVDGTEKVAASVGGSNYGILISSIKTWVLSSISGLTTAMFAANVVDTDTTLAANSDARLASQKAVKAYADALIAANDAMVFKGATDCSANPNYPAADRGHTYRVSVAGKIGGASGVVVEVGDMFICNTDATSTGNQATVGANWNLIQTNIDGAVTGPASATSGNLPTFNGTSGKVIQDSGVAVSTDGTFASNVDTKVPTEKATKTLVNNRAQSIMGTTGSTQIAAGSTNYVTPGQINASESAVYLPFPVAGIVKNLFAYSAGSPGAAGQSYTYTFRNALADTALTCSIGSGFNAASDTAHSITVAAGDRWSIKAVATGAAAATNVLFSFTFQPTQ